MFICIFNTYSDKQSVKAGVHDTTGNFDITIFVLVRLTHVGAMPGASQLPSSVSTDRVTASPGPVISPVGF